MIRFVVAALALSLASPALAQPMVGSSNPRFGENAPANYESSQWWAFELKFGPYVPDIDSSPGLNGAHPFRDLFNPQGVTTPVPPKLLTQLELDFQFLHKHGSLGVGASVGFYNRYTHSFNYNNPTSSMPTACTVPNCMRSGDVTNLYILPLELLAVYRWDWLAKRYRVPLVPYAKIGLAYYIWWITNGSGSTSSFTASNGMNQSGYGGTFGFVLRPGISFLLDVIDPTAAKVMDSEIGINHTYLFIELNYANIAGFGKSDVMVLSDTSFSAGLAFEF